MNTPPDQAQLTLWVQPGASRAHIVGPFGDALKVAVAAAPEKGKANAALKKLLANALGMPVRALTLAAGNTSRRKVVIVHGLSQHDAQTRLAARMEK